MINMCLCDGDETVIGWFLQVDREVPLAKVVHAYFEVFLRALLKCLLANLKSDDYGESFERDLMKELKSMVDRMVGLVAVRTCTTDIMQSEYLAYRLVLSEANPLGWNHPLLRAVEANGNTLRFLGLESVSVPTQTTTWNDCDALSRAAAIAMAAAELTNASNSPTENPSASGRGGRRSRGRKTSAQSITSTTVSIDRDEHPNQWAQLDLLSVTIDCCDSSQDHVDQMFVSSSPSNSSLLKSSLASSISDKEGFLQKLMERDHESIRTSYTEQCKEYETLLLLFKILSQSDEVIMKKLSAMEEYEERMRKLGIKIKQALSPEDLLRSLTAHVNNTN